MDKRQQIIFPEKIQQNIFPDKIQQNIFPDEMQKITMGGHELREKNFVRTKAHLAIAHVSALQVYFRCILSLFFFQFK